MRLTIVRYSTSDDCTLGALLINGRFACYTLEDTHRSVKLLGETRIPSGIYRVELKKSGQWHTKMSQRMPDIHEGMLEICDVPEFTDILIHPGNFAADTKGCILVGDEANNNQTGKGHVMGSLLAYSRVYPIIAAALLRGEECLIMIGDPVELFSHVTQISPR